MTRKGMGPVLGVETSCDETALAVVEDGRLLAQELATQVDVHALFGGVVPEVASREHYRLLDALFARLLERTGLVPWDFSAVAVARGPGLLGALLVGVGFAKGLAAATGARLVGVNHLHAHLLAAWLEEPLPYPALGLLVSGGHTDLYLMRDDPVRPEAFQPLGRTLDDAAGEAFDKVGKMLNLPYPAGAALDRLARQCAATDTTLFTKPYLANDNLDFSFSGLKTQAQTYLQARPCLRFARPPERGADLAVAAGEQGVDHAGLTAFAAAFCHTVAATLCAKTERALDHLARDTEPVRALVAAGGVAAGGVLRAMLAELAARWGLRLVLPSPGLCTDNAAMVACAGERLARAGLSHGLDMEAVARGAEVPFDYVGCGGGAR